MIKTESQIIDACSRCFLFDGIGSDNIGVLLDSVNYNISEYRNGEIIVSSDKPLYRFGIVLRGGAEAYTVRESGSVLLRSFNTGECFGAAAVFSDDDEPNFSVIKAKTNFSSTGVRGKTKVLLLSRQSVLSLMEKDRNIVSNYISFLCGRIGFLNRKIDILTSESAERRLAAYLLECPGEDGRVDLQYMSALSCRLNIGRASLYRAFELLAPAVTRNKNHAQISNRVLLRDIADGRIKARDICSEKEKKGL